MQTERSQQTTSDCSVVIMAAGRGTRMKSATPKVLHDLCGRTLLGHTLVAAEGLNPRHVIAVVRHERDLVAAEVERVAPAALVADQDDVMGTGRAVQCGLIAAEQAGVELGDTVVVTSGDVPLLEAETLRQLVTSHQDSGAAVTVVTTVADDPSGYGRVLREETGEGVIAIVEHKDATDEQLAVTEINAGIYAFDAKFLAETLRNLGSDNAQGEVYLTDTVAAAVASGRGASAFVLEDTWQAEGCNDLVQLASLRQELTGRIIRRHQRAGVSIVDPLTTSIDVQVQLDADAIVLPCTQLYGKSQVESGAVIGPSSTLRDVRVGANATVPHSVLHQCSVAEGQSLAPFTVVGE